MVKSFVTCAAVAAACLTFSQQRLWMYWQ